VSADRAAAAALVLHAISFVPITLVGSVFMMREGLTLAGARRLAKEAPGGEEAGTTPVAPGLHTAAQNPRGGGPDVHPTAQNPRGGGPDGKKGAP
jgi:hypothetical protein